MPKLNLKSRIIGHAEESPENLTANPLNFRRHPKEQIAALKGSMKELGWIKTVIVNKRSGYVLDGHARVEEAIRQGLPTIPVTYVDLDENEERLALAVLDPITELAYRDDETLKLLLEQANASDQDLKEFLQTLNNQEAESGLLPNADEDEVPEPPKTPITKLGDLILLGNHRLLCGDATKIEDVEKLMDGKKADMVFTDPPYGMNLNTDFQDIHSGATTGSNHRKVINDDKQFDPYCILTIKAKDVLIWGADYFHHKLPLGGSWYCWDKTLGDFDGRIGNELELLWSKVPHKRIVFRHKWVGYNGLQTQDTKTRVHPNQKPIELLIKCIELFEHKIILDLFGGSGSTMIACEKTNRHCFMMELDPIYCDVIIERWEKATGKKAIRQ